MWAYESVHACVCVRAGWGWGVADESRTPEWQTVILWVDTDACESVCLRVRACMLCSTDLFFFFEGGGGAGVCMCVWPWVQDILWIYSAFNPSSSPSSSPSHTHASDKCILTHSLYGYNTHSSYACLHMPIVMYYNFISSYEFILPDFRSVQPSWCLAVCSWSDLIKSAATINPSRYAWEI